MANTAKSLRPSPSKSPQTGVKPDPPHATLDAIAAPAKDLYCGNLFRFARAYAELGAESLRAVRAYAGDVAAGRFPGPRESAD